MAAEGGCSSATAHPYSPSSLDIPLFRPNESPLWLVVVSFGSIVAIVLGAAVALAKTFNPRVKSVFALCWFALCGFLHCAFEGYFVYHFEAIAGRQDLFAQLWKEYALSDSRYLALDPFVLSIETITVFIWGPLCIFIVVCIIRESPMRHPLQIVMCIGHLYGVALYYASSLVERSLRGGAGHSRPEFLHFWVYFVGFNIPWVIVPTILLADSLRNIRKAVVIREGMGAALERNRDILQEARRVKVDKKTR